MPDVRRRLFYLVDWLAPDFGATGQYALIFATEQARAGRDVCLIGLASGAKSQSSQAFDGGGRLTVLRIHARPRGGEGYLSRLFWAISTNLQIALQAWRRIGADEAELIFTGSPPFMLYFAVGLKAVRNVALTYRITDFYPEVVIAAAGRKSLLAGMLERLTWAARRKVENFQVLGEDQRHILLAGGIAAGRIDLVRDRSPVDFASGQTALPRPPALGGRLTLLYSGNFGVAHEVDTVLDGLARHHGAGSDRFALWINGSGGAADKVADGLRAAGAPVARTPPVPLDQLASLLMAADVHLITLRSAFSGYVLPSKVYGCIASGRPILFVGPATSDVHLLCSRAPGLSYRRIEPGDVANFLAALEAFADELGEDESRLAGELRLDPEVGRLQP